MAKDSCNLKASGTFNIHEEAIWALHKALELVGSGLGFGGRVQKINRHLDWTSYIKSTFAERRKENEIQGVRGAGTERMVEWQDC